MTTQQWFKNKLESFKEDFGYRYEVFLLEFTEKIVNEMEEKNITRTKFAKLLNVSLPAITKILNGNNNFTLKTLLSIADALNQELKIEFIEKRIEGDNFFLPEESTEPAIKINRPLADNAQISIYCGVSKKSVSAV